MGLVGESGSGKTVTAMMVSGLLRPEQADFRGRILLDGEDLLHAGGQRIRAIQGKDILCGVSGAYERHGPHHADR